MREIVPILNRGGGTVIAAEAMPTGVRLTLSDSAQGRQTTLAPTVGTHSSASGVQQSVPSETSELRRARKRSQQAGMAKTAGQLASALSRVLHLEEQLAASEQRVRALMSLSHVPVVLPVELAVFFAADASQCYSCCCGRKC